MSIVKQLLRMIMPLECVRCGGTLHRAETVCQTCLKQVKENAINRIFPLRVHKKTIYFNCKASSLYDKTLKRNIRRFKFSGKTVYAEGLGVMMAETLTAVSEEFDAVTYVPMTRKRQRQKGYNQAQLLAAELADNMHLPLLQYLEKQEETQSQHMLSGKARRENLKGKFHGILQCEDQRILLVDDVITTGSTMCECAAVLYRQGAQMVYGICAASSLYFT